MYDFVVIGGGIGGLMFSYAAMEINPKAKILMVDRGLPLENRKCPIVTGKSKTCLNCKSCSIMEGIGGCGAFSDGKFIKTTEYGGNLSDYIGVNETLSHIEYVDDVLKHFGATEKEYHPNNDIKTEALKYDLHVQQAVVKHLGTDGNRETMLHLINDLSSKIEIETCSKVEEIYFSSHTIILENGKIIQSKKIVIAVGRVGADWFSEICSKNRIGTNSGQVDVGVRVELPREIWEDISKVIYEPKILYRTKQYGDRTRMFCFNSGGSVVTENSDGILTVNGHANAMETNKTKNSNFAILSTINFTTPFNDPIKYVKHISELSNMISGGSVIIQRFGDLVNGVRSTEKRIAQSTVVPTLEACPGDLSLCIPKRQLDNIIETIYAFNKLCPGTSNFDTLLYGVEAKYYSVRPKFLNNSFEIYDGIYTIGDCCGVTRGLAQAGAMGVFVAEQATQTIA